MRQSTPPSAWQKVFFLLSLKCNQSSRMGFDCAAQPKWHGSCFHSHKQNTKWNVEQLLWKKKKKRLWRTLNEREEILETSLRCFTLQRLWWYADRKLCSLWIIKDQFYSFTVLRNFFYIISHHVESQPPLEVCLTWKSKMLFSFFLI